MVRTAQFGPTTVPALTESITAPGPNPTLVYRGWAERRGMSDSEGRYAAGSVDDLPVGSATIVQCDDEPVAVVHGEGGFYALHNVCPHSGGPLGDGKVEGDSLYCPWHGYQFELATGEHAQGLPLATETYEVVVEDGELYVSM